MTGSVMYDWNQSNKSMQDIIFCIYICTIEPATIRFYSEGSARTPIRVRDVTGVEATFGSEGIECYFGRSERRKLTQDIKKGGTSMSGK